MKPRLRMLYSDTTPQAYLQGLWRNSRYAGLIEDEAGRFVAGPMLRDLGLLNKLWDGRTITVDRKGGSFVVRNPRSVLHLMVQPSIFREFMEKKGEKARGIGLLARCLVCFPLSTQGTRLNTGIRGPRTQVDAFARRILALLEDQIDLLTPEVHEDEC
ncbi:MAG: DUF3987 domain-containing protein [Rhodocyclaceae bacterium]